MAAAAMSWVTGGGGHQARARGNGHRRTSGSDTKKLGSRFQSRRTVPAAAKKPRGKTWCACTPGGSTACATASPRSDSEAQDLTQEVFLRVFRSLKSFRSTEGSFATWLARLTRNLLIDHYRRTRQERVTDSIEEQLPMLEESVAASARPDGMVAGREASEILQAALQKLSPELREAVILRDLQDMEYREISEVLKIPEGTVKSRLNRGRAELARVLRKQKVLV